VSINTYWICSYATEHGLPTLLGGCNETTDTDRFCQIGRFEAAHYRGHQESIRKSGSESAILFSQRHTTLIPILPILIRTTVATIVAYLGGLTGLLVDNGAKSRSRIICLINCALGALLAVTVLDILPDAMEPLKQFSPQYALVLLIIATGVGWILFWLLGRYVYPVCPACSMGDHHHQKSLLTAGTLLMMMFALSVHSTMDGMAVVVGDEVVHGINLPVFFAVTLHKYPEGLALMLLLMGSGYKKMSAFGWVLVIEGTTELGALAALFLLRGIAPVWMGMTFACIGGGFLYLVLNAFALVRQSTVDDTPSKVPLFAGGAAFMLTGLLIFISNSVPH